MKNNDKNIPLDPDVAAHICPVSASMVGVCLTTIGLIRVVVAVNKVETFADNLLAVDAIIFLTATLASYYALRVRSTRRLHALERIADIAFISGICVMTIACIFMTVVMAI